MSFASFFGFGGGLLPGTSTQYELPEIFPLNIELHFFVDTDIINVYSKILTDCIDRVGGIPDEVFPLLWDNFLQNESCYGLISLLSRAMLYKRNLFLVYDPAIGLLREASSTESSQIRTDYQTKGTSDLGIHISFGHYHRTDMVRLYSSMEYSVISSLNKLINVSKAVQLKMSEMRSSVNLGDSQVAIDQAKSIARSLSKGKDIMLDKNDEITTCVPDITPTKESIAFLDGKRSFYYGMPLSYINGEQTAGIGSTGEADTKAVERGLRQYYISILKPVLEALFEIDTTFKSNDFRQIGSALEAVKTFELVNDDLISKEDKKLIISKLFDLEPSVE